MTSTIQTINQLEFEGIELTDMRPLTLSDSDDLPFSSIDRRIHHWRSPSGANGMVASIPARSNKSLLIRHLKNVHVSPGAHPCCVPGCDKVCNRADNLAQHMKNVHS